MSEESSKEFEIRIDEESPDAVFQDDIKNLRLEKLGKRVTIISILIPCFIALLLVLVYLDLRNRVTANQSTGVTHIQSLSKDFDTRLDELSAQLSKIEESLASNISTYEKKLSSLKFRVYKSENRIKKIKSSKVDKKELTQFSTKLDNLDVIFSGKLTGLSAEQNALKKDLAKLTDDISSLSSQKTINRIYLDDQLKKQQKNQQQELDQLQKELKAKVFSMQKQLNAFEKKMKLSGNKSQNSSKPVSPAKPPVNASPKTPGKIIEKDL